MDRIDLDAYCTGCNSDQGTREHDHSPHRWTPPHHDNLWCDICWDWQRPLEDRIKGLARRGQKAAESDATSERFIRGSDPEFPFELGNTGYQSDADRLRAIEDHVKRVSRLGDPNYEKSGYAPRKIELAELVVALGTLYLAERKRQELDT